MDLSGGKSAVSDQNDTAVDLTTGGKDVADLPLIPNIPEDLSFHKLDDKPWNNGNDNSDPQGDPLHDFTGPGAHTYQLYNYKYRIESLSHNLINVSNITVRMEENSAVCGENIQFTNIVDEYGKVLITKANMLLDLGTKIQKIRNNYSNKFPPLPKRKKHEHTVITWQPPKPTEDVVIDSDLILTQQNPDDDKNTYHNPGKFPPMTKKRVSRL